MSLIVKYWTAGMFGGALPIPIDVVATAISESRIDLTWTNTSTGYQIAIERAVDGGSYALIHTAAPGTTSYTDETGLVAATRYSYRLRYLGTKNSNYSRPGREWTPIKIPLVKLGTGAGVATINLQSSANMSITLDGAGLFYDNAAGTTNPGTSRTVTPGAMRTFYLKVTTGTSYLRIFSKDTWLRLGSYDYYGWTSATNAPRLDLTLAMLPQSLISFDCAGNNYVTGNIASLPRNLDYFYLWAGQTLTGNVADLPRTLTYFVVDKNIFSGDVKDLPRGLTFFYCTGVNFAGATIGGNVKDLPPYLTDFLLTGSNVLTGDLKDIPRGIIRFHVIGYNTIYGNLADVPPNINYLTIYSTTSRISDYTPGRTWPSLMKQVWVDPSTAFALRTTDIDNLLIDLAEVDTWDTPKVVHLSGRSAARSSASDAAVATLISKGVTLSVNTGSAAPDAAPSNLVLTVVSDTQIDATVDINATNADGVSWEYSTDGVTYTEHGTSVLGAYSYTGLIENTLYYFRCRNYRSVNYSSYCAVKSDIAFPTVLLSTDTYAFYDTLTIASFTKNASEQVMAWADFFGRGESLVNAGADNLKPILESDGLLFDGVRQFLKTAAALALDQPTFIYLVIKQVTWTASDYFFDGNTDNKGMISQIAASPYIRSYAGITSGNILGPTGGVTHTSGTIALNKYSIIRCRFNGAGSLLQVDEMTANTVDTGTNVMGGFTLGANGTATAFWSNIKVKAVLLRTVDDALNHDNIYKFLRVRYLKDVAIIGDSIVAAYSAPTYVSVAYLMDWDKGFLDIALAGNTIAQQKTAWSAKNPLTRAYTKCVFILVGLNDMNPAIATATTIAAIQDLVDTVRADIGATNKIIICTMTPCKAWLETEYAPNGAVAYQKWLDMNEAIRGNGATPITSVDGYIDAHTTEFNDGSGNINATYDIGDHLHENNDGRQFIADLWDAKLLELGI